MTHEYFRAVESYHLPYRELKRMTRQSVEHSFLPGQSLWSETKSIFRPVTACGSDDPGKEKPSVRCAKFLDANEHAREQWKLESAFAEFEKKF
jgi:adenosine deaminase